MTAPPSGPPGNAANAIVVFFGWAMVVVGCLIGGLGGLCTLAMLSDGSREARAYAVIGVVPLVMGGSILVAGILVLCDRARRRWAPKPEDLSRFSDWTPPDA